jgi:Putative transposase
VPVKALGKIFRAKFRAALKKTSLDPQVPPPTWKQNWVVHCEPAGSGQAVLKYLAPYVFRVALSNNRILKLENGQVTFRYQDGQTKKQQIATLPAPEFIRRFLQHVLPHRFQKVRCFGFFRPQQRQHLQQIKAGLAVPPSAQHSLPQPLPTDDMPNQPDPKVIRCPHCGRPMQLVEELPRQKLSSGAPRPRPALRTDCAAGQSSPRAVFQPPATAQNATSGHRSHPQILKHRNCFPLSLDSNLKSEPRLVQPRIVRRLTS